MRLRAFVVFLGIGGLVLAQTPACRPVEADSILARDLATALPAFGKMPPETWLANTPQPGSQRVFHSAEILSLAERYSLRVDANASACFERAMEPLNRDRVVEAMRSALKIPDARIEVSETNLYPVPRGRIEFDPSRLGTPASPDQRAPVLWSGDMIYGQNHRFAIWARVRIWARRELVVAAENLKPGREIEPSQLRTNVDEGFPRLKEQAEPTRFVGMVPIRPIAAGAVVTSELLALPNEVNRGDLLEIEVRSGAARLVLTARAESGGREGDTITVRNPESNKAFAAKVVGKGKALVVADSTKAE